MVRLNEPQWMPTEHAVYAALWAVHHQDLVVFASATRENYMLTAWGFKDADAPLMRSVAHCSWDREAQEEDPYEWSYYIAKVVADHE